MLIATVVGNRPQFVKAAAVSTKLREVAQEVLVHTGQHHDDELSRIFFDELGLPRPEHRLDAGGGTNTGQTAAMLAALEPLLALQAPDVVLVYGDTNSTLAAALAAAQKRIPVAHVEAGMRSFDRDMPEELNRVLADHASEILFCSTPTAVDNLANENVRERVHLVGDVMADVALAFLPMAKMPAFYESFIYLIFLWVSLSTSWALLSGFAGYFSLGHAAFFGVGVYTTAAQIGRASCRERV